MTRSSADTDDGADAREWSGRHGAPRADAVERAFARASTRLLRPAVVSSMFLVTTARGIRFTAASPLEAWGGGPLIFAANHQSHADTPAILWTLPAALRRRTAVAAASDTFGFEVPGLAPTLGRRAIRHLVVAGFRAYPFDRRSAPLGSLELSAELLARGWSLLMFPEGTRGRDGRPRPFKTGIGWLARESGAPVVPVHVDGGRSVLPPGAFWPRPGRIVVRFGAPLGCGARAEPDAFTATVEREVRALGGGVPPDSRNAPEAATSLRGLPPSGEAVRT